MNSRNLQVLLVFTIGGFLAIWLGFSVVTSQVETLMQIAGVVMLAICLLLGRRVWLLLPFLGALQLTLMIPGRPTTLLLAQALVVGFSALMFLTRKLPFRLKMTELEWWVVLLVACVAQVYLRNPVGLSLFGGDMVGGRPYILFAVTIGAAVVLCGMQVPPRELHLAMKLSIFGGILNLCVGFVGWLVPSMGMFLGVATPQRQPNEIVDREAATRVGFLVHIPLTLSKWVSAYRSPLLACFSPRWMPLILLSLGFAALSGYRNVVGAVCLTYLVGILYRGGLVHVLVSLVLFAAGIGVLAVVNTVAPLPANIQRAISFLPGTWEKRHIADATNSNEWRYEMWEEALLSDRWIANKVLGDGLGFTAYELNYAKALADMRESGIGTSGLDLAKEAVMVNGDYHSGPVSAVRTIGYVGLLVMALAQIRLGVHAHRQIVRCKGTEWYPVALFFGIPIIWNPVFFWLIFGGFAGDAPFILMSAGMLRMLQNNLPLPAYVPGKRQATMSAPVPADRNAVPVR